MKKILIILIILFLIIIFSIYALKINYNIQTKALKDYNIQYEIYLNKTIEGNELATLINKAVNLNEYNKIEKNKKNHYIENEENSLKIEIKMLLTDKTYPMEEIYNNNTAEFVRFFNNEKFECTNIEYHNKTGKVSKIIFVQTNN